MTRKLMLPAASAALFLSSAAWAGDEQDRELAVAPEAEVTATITAPSAAPEHADEEAPVVRARMIELRDTPNPVTAVPVPPSVEAEPVPAKLVNFNGGERVLVASKRLRIWRSHLAYRLTVDEQGMPTDCELTEKFRRKYISVELCRVLIEHHEFEPARDEMNRPVEGTYSARLSYLDLRNAE